MPTYILELPPKVETSDALTTNTQSTTTDSDIIIESTPDPVSQEETSGLQSARAQSNSNVEKSELEPTPKSISSKVKENVMVIINFIDRFFFLVITIIIILYI